MGSASDARRLIFAQLAARAQAADAIQAQSPAGGTPPTASRAGSPPLAPQSVPSAGGVRLPRKAWLQRELAQEQLQERIAHRAKAKVKQNNSLHERASEWTVGREQTLNQARAKARKYIESVSAARGYYRELCLDPVAAHFAIALKKLCDAHGWTLADLAARRALALIVFFRSCATPFCWNARFARAPSFARSRRPAKLGRSLESRKYSPTVRGVARPYLATVLAWPGHSPEDDRSVDVSTVSDHTARLVEVSVLQRVQVPQHAADSGEIGASGHVINRYHLADKGSRKPALSGCWTVDGELVDAEVLQAPWTGARATRSPNAPDPPS